MKAIRVVIQIAFLVIFFIVVAKGNMFLWFGLFILSLLGATFLGRFYCGYICPMNTIMRITEKISIKMNWRTEKTPKLLVNKYFSWVVLLQMIAVMILSKKVLHHEIPMLIILLVLSVIVTLRYESWVFHNHICPFGALLNLTGRWAMYSTKVDESKCVGCKKCEKVCPSKAIKVDSINRMAEINRSLCHQCQECTCVCPKNAIHYK